MTRQDALDPLAAFLERHAENVQLNVMMGSRGFVANMFVMDWSRRGRVVQEFFYWSAAHSEIPQPTIEAAIEQLRLDIGEVGDQFFIREVAYRLVNLVSQPPGSAADSGRALEELAVLIRLSRVNAQSDWVHELRVWCAPRIEEAAFSTLIQAVETQLAQLR